MTGEVEVVAGSNLVLAVFFRVDGIPRGKGSFRMVKSRRTGKMFPVIDSDKALDWSEAISQVARYTMGAHRPLDSACLVQLSFRIPRPAGHWTKVGGQPSADWRDYPDRHGHGRYDVDKMERLVLDAMNQIVFTDDSRVCDVVKRTRYALRGEEQPGVDVQVLPLPALDERQARPRGGVVINRTRGERA